MTLHRVVCYFARAHGLAGLQALLQSDRYRVVAIATHRRLPKAEDASRAERADYAEYLRLAAQLQVPLLAVDGERAQGEAIDQLDKLRFDAIAAISWRRLLTPRQLAQPRIGGVNLHRGALPKYAGAEPVLRALRAGEGAIEICAHLLTERVDDGPVLARVSHPVTARAGEDISQQVERIKHEMTPRFGPLLIEALDQLVSRHGH